MSARPIKFVCFNALFRDEGCKFCTAGSCHFTQQLQVEHFGSSVTLEARTTCIANGYQVHCLEFFRSGVCTAPSPCPKQHSLRYEFLTPTQQHAFQRWNAPPSAGSRSERGRGRGRGRGSNRGAASTRPPFTGASFHPPLPPLPPPESVSLCLDHPHSRSPPPQPPLPPPAVGSPFGGPVASSPTQPLQPSTMHSLETTSRAPRPQQVPVASRQSTSRQTINARPARGGSEILCFNQLFRLEGCRFCRLGSCNFSSRVQGSHFESPDVAMSVLVRIPQSSSHCQEFFERGACSVSGGNCGRGHILLLQDLASDQQQAYARWSHSAMRRKSAVAAEPQGMAYDACAASPPLPPTLDDAPSQPTTSGHPSSSPQRFKDQPAQVARSRLPPTMAMTTPSSSQTGASSTVAETPLCWIHLFSARGCKFDMGCAFNHVVQLGHLKSSSDTPMESRIASRPLLMDSSSQTADSAAEHRAHCTSFFANGLCSQSTTCGRHHVLMKEMLNETQQRAYDSWRKPQDASSGFKGHTDAVHGPPVAGYRNSRKPQSVGLKSQSQRDADRKSSQFPILQCKDVFVRRLAEEKVLIVTAATGSGKTTQLPQYAAESPAFTHGLVVCTQPRAIAALSISQRIAEEFDGTKTGQSVGYCIGGKKEHRGRRIMLMTDAVLVRMAQQDRLLSQISVLIIDEAHERSLNTDLVVAISKIVLQERADFHVVIASATIDPKPFLSYYFGASGSLGHSALEVPGRLHDVKIEELPLDDSISNQRAFTTQLIRIIKKTLLKHPIGHCLVFLSGSGEIEAAIKAFEKDKEDEWIPKPLYGSLPPEVQSEVLNFDDDGGRLRMVCFCTNVAETSLTVPNVRIVIDSGLAKEARYDGQRRMSVVEEVYVSVASADQRTGRAGRTAAGHCVRLYRSQDLPRANIQPEILRSSLDMVVLQLVKLGHDPLTFPFMDKPNPLLLARSVDMLQELGCIRKEPPGGHLKERNSTQWKLTQRGQVFSSMPFDPRMSHFVLSAFEKDVEFLEPAAEIAAILTAPGSIFFLGGADKAEKLSRQATISSNASLHDSDLLFLRSVYRDWYESGLMDANNNCLSCGCAAKPGQNGCKRCRTMLANDMSLNNKVLSVVQGTVQQVTAVILQQSSSASSAGTIKSESSSPQLLRKPSKRTLEVVLGECLAKCFFDQLCQIILPSKPEAGVYLLEADEKGSIGTTSAISQRIGMANTRDNSLYIAMCIKQIPSGEYKVEQLHRILLEWLPDARRAEIDRKAFHVEPCYVRNNIAFQHVRGLENHFLRWNRRYHEKVKAGAITPRGSMPKLTDLEGMEPDAFADYAVCAYDQAEHSIYVYGPQLYSGSISSIADSFLTKVERDLLSYEWTEVIGRGTAIATYSAGLQAERLEPVGVACRVDLHKLVGITSKTALVEFVLKRMKNKAKANSSTGHTIRWAKFYSVEEQLDRLGNHVKADADEITPKGTIVFASDTSAETARASLREFVVKGDDSTAVQSGNRLSSSDHWGRMVLWKSPTYHSVDDAKTTLGEVPGLLALDTTRMHSKTVEFVEYSLPAFKILAKNLPPSTTEETLNASLPPGLTATSISFAKEDKYGVRCATLFFRSASVRDSCLAHLVQSPLAKATVTVALPKRTIQSTPQFASEPSKDVAGRATFELVFNTADHAEAFVLRDAQSARGFAHTDVKHSSLYRLDAICQSLAERFDVDCSQFSLGASGGRGRQDKSDTVRVVFVGASPSACGQACQALLLATSSLRIVICSVEQRLMLEELDVAGKLAHWEQDLGLKLQYARSAPHATRQPRLHGLTIFGESTRQGEFMRRIADYAVTFTRRFLVLNLGDSAGLFRPGRAGFSVTNKLQREFEGECSITLDKVSEALQIFVAASVSPARTAEIRETCNAAVDEVLVSASKGKVAGSLSASECVYCRMKSDLQLTLCGHAACKGCLRDVLRTHATAGAFVPVCCGACGKRIPVVDLRKLEAKEALAGACLASARAFLASQGGSRLRLCPSVDCGAFLTLPVADGDGGGAFSYMACPGCGDGLCLDCDVVNDDRHRGKSCAEYRTQRDLERTFDLGAVFKRAEEWANAHWDVSIAPKFSAHVNESLLHGSPAFARYVAGIVASGGLTEVASRRVFAWHGTAEGAIGPICRNGFDPTRRSGQAHGPGEYFGLSPGVSMGYTRGSTRLLVAELITGHQLIKTVSNFCYVVCNPRDWSHCFNLPVLVLSFGAAYGHAPQFEPASPEDDLGRILATLDPTLAKSARPRATGSTRTNRAHAAAVAPLPAAAWTSPFRWHWWDNAKFEPYADAINALLESAFMRGERTFVTPPIVRYVDDLPQVYRVHFRDPATGVALGTMQQVNAKTGFTRAIRRERDPIAPVPQVTWVYAETGGRWCKFESTVQRTIEAAFEAYVIQAPGAASTLTLHFPGRREGYTLDFVQGTQVNAETGTQRPIRRRSGLIGGLGDGAAAGAKTTVRAAAVEEATLDVDLTAAMRASNVLAGLGRHLNGIVRAALATTTTDTGSAVERPQDADVDDDDKWVAVSIRDRRGVLVDDDDDDDNARGRPSEVVLTLRGPAITLCGLLVARVRVLLREQHGVHAPLRGIHARGPHGRTMLQNPRLLQLLSGPTPPPAAATTSASTGASSSIHHHHRDEVMLQLAHAILWDAHAGIYGGFVRDWVLVGDSANDLDVHLAPPHVTIASVSAALQQRLTRLAARSPTAASELRLTTKGQKGAAHCLVVSGPTLPRAIEIDLVDPAGVPVTPPGVDADVGNVLLTRDGLAKKVPTADGGRISLEKTIRHARRKAFVFYYDPLGGADDAVWRRLCKYLDRQWTCLSPLPEGCHARLTPVQRKYLRPKDKYDVQWWSGRSPAAVATPPSTENCNVQ